MRSPRPFPTRRRRCTTTPAQGVPLLELRNEQPEPEVASTRRSDAEARRGVSRAAPRGHAPGPWRSAAEPAGVRASGGSPSSGVLTFTPIPQTTVSPVDSSRIAGDLAVVDEHVVRPLDPRSRRGHRASIAAATDEPDDERELLGRRARRGTEQDRGEQRAPGRVVPVPRPRARAPPSGARSRQPRLRAGRRDAAAPASRRILRPRDTAGRERPAQKRLDRRRASRSSLVVSGPRGAVSPGRAGASTRAAARATPRSGAWAHGAARRAARRRASRRAARPRAPGSSPGCARPARPRGAPGRPCVRSRVASGRA